MGIPEEIRRIDRPRNTVVYMIREGLYGVRERAGVKYSKAGNPCPINGKVVGHIENGMFIPLKAAMANEPSFLSYGSSALAKDCSDGIYEDLVGIYPLDAARSIMAMAALKVIKPSIKCSRYDSEYTRTFVSRYYPGCHLSRNTVGKLLGQVGMDAEKRKAFYLARIARIPKEHHIAIDGTLRQDSSTVNSLSGFSYKSRVKGTKDVSVIYAYDIETKEPACSAVFPGNSIDATSYRQFLTQNGITKGIIVSDKGFPVSAVADILEKNRDLHFLTPLRRNDARIEKNGMLSFEEIIEGIEGDVFAKKKKITDKRYLYSYLDVSTMGKEAHDFVKHARKGDVFDAGKYEKKKLSFGTITLESDLDMTCREAYLCYAERWKIELVFRAYKNDIGLRETNVQVDYSVIGMEFVDFISAIITTRIIERMRGSGLLEKATYAEVMEDLTNLWRQADSVMDKPSVSDGKWANALPMELEEMKALGLVREPVAPKKRGRGRPRKKTDANQS